MGGRKIDIGLFAESLIYYDCVIANVTGQLQFAEFLQWFAQQGSLDDFLALVSDGSVKLYDYAFVSAPVEKDGSFIFLNIQDKAQAESNSFVRRYLYHPAVETVLPRKPRHRQKFYNVIGDNVIEVKADEFGNSVQNARIDCQDSVRIAHFVQAFTDELYRIKGLGAAPTVSASVAISEDGKTHITFNSDFDHIAKLAGDDLHFGPARPLMAAIISNRFIWSAAGLGCDMYLPTPMSSLVGDKLYESSKSLVKTDLVIEQLKNTVEFPDIRQLVNDGKLRLSDVLMLRKKSQRFRDWLQDESGRDRDAIIAYHHDVAREAGFTKSSRKALRIFGVLGGGAVGASVGSAIAGPLGGAAGGLAGTAVGYVADLVSKLGADWKPVVFGNWQREQIDKILRDRDSETE